MDGGNGDSRNSQSESLAINANEATFRVSQNGGLPTFATQTQLANGSAQMQAANSPQEQDASKGQTSVSDASVGLAITEVTGAIPQAVSSVSAGEDGRGQVAAIETTAGSVSGTVVIPQEYLTVGQAGAQAYVPTEPHNVSGKYCTTMSSVTD
jgi:hypothetical protein